MKKSILLLFLASFLAFYSCKDEVAPLVLLEGEAQMNHVLNEPFEEPGYKAFDDLDGDITESVVAPILNVDSAGVHNLTYTVRDAEGNMGEAIREVTVINESESYTGIWYGAFVQPYPGVDATNYTDSLVVSTTTNMGVVIKNFANNAGAMVEGVIMPSSGNNQSGTITFNGQSVGGEALHVTRGTMNSGVEMTIEYTLGADQGVLVLKKH